MGYEQLEQSMTPSLTSATNLPPGMPMVVQSSNQTRVVVTSVAAGYAQPGVIRQQSAPQQGRQQILQQRGPQGNIVWVFPPEVFIQFQCDTISIFAAKFENMVQHDLELGQFFLSREKCSLQIHTGVCTLCTRNKYFVCLVESSLI